MKKAILAIFFVALLSTGLMGQRHMLKQRLFKVDPVSGLFKEIRVSVEHRLIKDYFLYLSPHGYHQNWYPKRRERWQRPRYPQKYAGLGLRAGVRRYFFPKDQSPQGFFVQAMAGYRHTWVNNLNNELQIDYKTRFHQVGFGGTVGYQWLYGPKKNFAYGFMGGFEYYASMFPKEDGFTIEDVTQNWFDFPFLGPSTLRGLRFYLGIELGFAFLQKHLHW